MTDHWQTIEDALEGKRALERILSDERDGGAHQRNMERIDAAIAFVREQRAAPVQGEYAPVRYSTFVEDQSYNDTYLLITLDGSQLEIGRDPTSDGVTVNLPSDMRLCRWQEVDTLTQRPQPTDAKDGGDAPDSAGWWAWEGYVNYAKGANPNRIERDVVRVFWGKTTNAWHCVGEKGRRPAYMMIGKWTRLTMPWDSLPKEGGGDDGE